MFVCPAVDSCRWTGYAQSSARTTTALTCDMQHGQHAEVTKHPRFLQLQVQSGGTWWEFRLASPTTPTRDVQRSQHEEVRPSARSCNTANFRCGNLADMKSPARGSLRTTNAMRDESSLLADCSSVRRWTAADGPGLPKFGSHRHQRLHVICSTASMKR